MSDNRDHCGDRDYRDDRDYHDDHEYRLYEIDHDNLWGLSETR
jgi:hypothetical protein